MSEEYSAQWNEKGELEYAKKGGPPKPWLKWVLILIAVGGVFYLGTQFGGDKGGDASTPLVKDSFTPQPSSVDLGEAEKLPDSMTKGKPTSIAQQVASLVGIN